MPLVGRGLIDILESNISETNVSLDRFFAPMPTSQLKKGSAEFLILSLLAREARHGYELSKLIEARSGGTVRFNVATLYPLLYKLEQRGWLQARWVEKPGQRRRRYYRLTPSGRTVLAEERNTWDAFVNAVQRITGPEYA